MLSFCLQAKQVWFTVLHFSSVSVSAKQTHISVSYSYQLQEQLGDKSTHLENENIQDLVLAEGLMETFPWIE